MTQPNESSLRHVWTLQHRLATLRTVCPFFSFFSLSPSFILLSLTHFELCNPIPSFLYSEHTYNRLTLLDFATYIHYRKQTINQSINMNRLEYKRKRLNCIHTVHLQIQTSCKVFSMVMFDSPRKQKWIFYWRTRRVQRERDEKSAKYFVNEIISKQNEWTKKNKICICIEREKSNYANGIKVCLINCERRMTDRFCSFFLGDFRIWSNDRCQT